MSTDNKIDIAIIGAGAAGTYTSWRLAKDPSAKDKKIKLFDFLKIDGEAHVGGRLWSMHMKDLEYTRKSEVGGMRYLTSQPIVTNIVPYLDMEDVPFVVDSIDNLFNLRSTILRTSEITDPDKVPFNLAPLERGMSPGGLLLYAVQTVVPNAPYLTAEEWLHVKKTFKANGMYLHELGFWNLLEIVLSEEGYQYVYSGQGYNTIPSNWNAADAMEWILADFGADASYRYLHPGYQELPKTLLSQALENKNVDFEKNMKLLKWEQLENHGDQYDIKLTFFNTKKKEEEIVYAERLVIAAPRKSLELIDMPKTQDMDKFYHELLPSVEPQPMFKFFLGYKYPWWRVLGMTSGRTITDNPLRQIYYWGSNYQKFFKPPADKESEEYKKYLEIQQNSVMMIYVDGRDVSYWQPLFELIDIQHKKFGKDNSVSIEESGENEDEFDVLKVKFTDLLNLLNDEMSFDKSTNFMSSSGDKLTATKNLINTITILLERAHGINFIPQPYAFVYADWTANPFGGAYNLWKPGYKSWEITKDIIKPSDKSEVYIVGEAYSTKQGWVEGAFETAEQMLETYFDLDRPSWLPEAKSYKIE